MSLLAVISVVDYMFINVFLTFYTLQVGPPKRRWARVTYPLTLLLTGLGALMTR